MSSENPVAKIPLSSRGLKFDWTGFAINILLPVAGVLVALLLGAIMLLFLKVNPLTAYAAIFVGAFSNASGVIQSLVKATDLLLVGLGICIAFRASVINIGGEGQIILGAIAATWWTLTFRTWTPWIVVTGAILVGFIAGAFWGFIPGILKARFNVNEILSTIMMNAIALQLLNLLLGGPLMDPNGVAAGTFLAQSERIPAALWLPRLIPQTLFKDLLYTEKCIANQLLFSIEVAIDSDAGHARTVGNFIEAGFGNTPLREHRQGREQDLFPSLVFDFDHDTIVTYFVSFVNSDGIGLRPRESTFAPGTSISRRVKQDFEE